MNTPSEIRLNKTGDTLAIMYGQAIYPMAAEYLRVCSPSAEVRAHSGEWQIVGGKKAVTILEVLPVGNYAVRLVFSDGHDSGIYSWDILHDLAHNHQRYWTEYLTALTANGQIREA